MAVIVPSNSCFIFILASAKELEQSLMNEYLSLLNERNMLTRREMYLNLL